MPTFTNPTYLLWVYSTTTQSGSWYATSSAPSQPYNIGDFTPLSQWSFSGTGGINFHAAYQCGDSGAPATMFCMFEQSQGSDFCVRLDLNQTMASLGGSVKPTASLVVGELVGDDPKVNVTQSTGEPYTNCVYLNYSDGTSNPWTYATTVASAPATATPPAQSSYAAYTGDITLTAPPVNTSDQLSTYISVANGASTEHSLVVAIQHEGGPWIALDKQQIDDGDSHAAVFEFPAGDFSVNFYQELSETPLG